MCGEQGKKKRMAGYVIPAYPAILQVGGDLQMIGLVCFSM